MEIGSIGLSILFSLFYKSYRSFILDVAGSYKQRINFPRGYRSVFTRGVFRTQSKSFFAKIVNGFNLKKICDLYLSGKTFVME